MAIRTRKTSAFVATVSGMDQTVIGRAQWRAALEEMGRNLQERIANTFAAQRTAAGALIANDPAYTAAKIRQGYDPRRGHRTNLLQSLLRSAASQLFVVIGPDRHGNGRIIMQEGRLQGLVRYAEYYAEKKVRGAGILEIAASWVKAASAPLLILEAEARTLTRAALAGRAPTIRASLGLTQRFASRIAQSARASAARQGQLSRLLGRVR